MGRLFSRRTSLWVSLFVLALTATPASAQYTWTGNGATNNWNDDNNWEAGATFGAPPNGSSVTLAGTTRLTNTLNYNLSVTSLTINNTAGAFVVSGTNTLTITTAAGFTDSDGSNQTFNANITAGAAQSWTNNNGGLLSFGGTVTTGAGLLTLAGTSDITIAGGAMSVGTGGLTVTNTGTVTLNSPITMTGATAITKNGAGALAVGATIDNGGFLLTVAGSGNSTYSAAISGAGGLTKNGTGTVTLSGVNTYGGATTVNGGVLRFNDNTAVGGAGASVTVNGDATTAAGFAIDQTFLGRHVLTSAGVIALAVDSGNALDMTGFTTARLGAVGAATYSGTLTPNGTAYLLGGGGGTLTISSALANNGGQTDVNVALNGTPTTRVILSGVNSYTGNTTVENGAILQFDASTAIGGTGASVTINAGATLSAGYAIDQGFVNRINPASTGLVVLAIDSGNNLDLSGAGANLAGVHIGALTSATYSGAMTANGNVYRLGGSGTLTVSGVLADSGGATSVDIGRAGLASTVILSGTTNTFTGGVTINAGNLRMGAVGTLNGNAVTFSAGSTGILQLNGFNTTIGGLSNTGTAGTVENLNAAAATSILTVNQASGSSTFGGVIRDGNAAAVLGLTKDGAGTFTLTGANTYTGATTVSGGILAVSSATALGATAGNTTVAAGAALEVSGAITIAEPLTLNGTGIANGGALRKTGANATVMSGAVTIASATRINSDANTLTISGAVGAAANNLTIGGAGDTTISGVITMTTAGTLAHDSASVLTISNAGNAATLDGALSVTAGGVLAFPAFTALGTDAGNGAITLDNGTLRNTLSTGTAATFSPATRNIVLGAGGGTLEWAGTATPTDLIIVQAGTVISGTAGGALNKTGAGIISIVTPATYDGPTNVLAGTLRIRTNDNVLPITTALTVASGARFDMDTAALDQQVGSLAGAGTVGVAGGIFTVDGATSTAFSGVITGTGGRLVKAGSSTLTLSGANTYTGSTTINAGTLQAGAVNSFAPASAVVLADAAGATLDLNNFNQAIGSLAGGGATGGNVNLGNATLTAGGNNSSTVYAGVIGGTGGLTKAGTGTLALNAANTYTGLTTVAGGRLSGSGSVSGPVEVNANAIFRGGVAGGTGTLTIGGNNPLTIKNGGILQIEVSRTGAGTADGSLINLTGGTSVLNLGQNPGDVIQIDIDGGTNPMVANETYTVTLASVGAGTINVNGSPVSGVIPTSAYTVSIYPFFTSVDNPVLQVSGGNLTFTFTPVPEPTTVLGLSAAALGVAGYVRRRKLKIARA